MTGPSLNARYQFGLAALVPLPRAAVLDVPATPTLWAGTGVAGRWERSQGRRTDGLTVNVVGDGATGVWAGPQPPRHLRGSGPRDFTVTSAPHSSQVVTEGRVVLGRPDVRRQAVQNDGTGPFAFTATDVPQREHEIVTGRPTSPF